jgi:hypothetical protein
MRACRICGASSCGWQTGIRLEHVGYKGSADALKDVLGGHVMLFSDTLLPTGGLAVKDGRLRGLVVAAARRVPMLPDVPTVAEAGLPANHDGRRCSSASWRPGGTPEPVVAQAQLRPSARSIADPACRRRGWSISASSLVGGGAADYGKRLAAETEKWRQGDPGSEDLRRRVERGAQLEPLRALGADYSPCRPPRRSRLRLGRTTQEAEDGAGLVGADVAAAVG